MNVENEKRKVLLKSGNQCAFPGCSNRLTDALQIAHIRSKKEKGPRHVPGWNNGHFDVEENLIALCPTHHNMIDINVEAFPIEKLEEMKCKHETRVKSAMQERISPDQAFIVKVFSILNNYSIINNLQHCDPTAPTESRQIDNLGYCQMDLENLINQSYGIGISDKLLKDWSIFSNQLVSYGNYLIPYLYYRNGFYVNSKPNESRDAITEFRKNLLRIIQEYI